MYKCVFNVQYLKNVMPQHYIIVSFKFPNVLLSLDLKKYMKL